MLKCSLIDINILQSLKINDSLHLFFLHVRSIIFCMVGSMQGIQAIEITSPTIKLSFKPAEPSLAHEER